MPCLALLWQLAAQIWHLSAFDADLHAQPLQLRAAGQGRAQVGAIGGAHDFLN